MKKFTIFTFCNKAKTNRNGLIPVYIYVIREGKQFCISPHLYTRTPFKGYAFPIREPNSALKTSHLLQIITEVERQCLAHDELPNEELKNIITKKLFDRETKRTPPPLLTDIIREVSAQYKGNTLQSYNNTIRKIENYTPTITLNKATTDWARGFDRHLEQSGLSQNSRALHYQVLHRAFNHAIDKGLITSNPMQKIKKPKYRKTPGNISVEQLRTIRDMPCTPKQQIYRDLFMLSFYLGGINAGDLLLLKPSINGRIVYTRQKTGHEYNLPIHPKAQEIIDRYKGKKHLLYIMDTSTNYREFYCKWQRAMETLSAQSGIKITTYTARYTFASIAAELGIGRDIVAHVLGHTWADTTSYYIAYQQKQIDDAIMRVIGFVAENK